MTYNIKISNPGKVERVVRSGITEESYLSLVSARDTLRYIMTVVDYGNMFVGNADEFTMATKHIWPSQTKGWADINRKFLNLVSAFYAYIEFMENTLKDTFCVIKKKYYDAHFEYRLVYNLRKYSTHRGLAISKTTYDGLNGSYSIQIVPLHLLEEGREFFQQTVRDELERMSSGKEEIDISDLNQSFKIIFQKMHDEIMQELEKLAMQSGEVLYSYYIDVKEPSEYTIWDESGEYLWSLSEVLLKYKEKIKYEYKPVKT